MTIMASGAPEAFAKCEQVLAAIAAKVYRLGDRPGPGSKRRLPELTRIGSRILACHNDPLHDSGFIRALMAEECPQFAFRERLDNPDDFPEQDPERSLKVLLFEREA
jgi:hypothetical protein